MGFLDRFRKRKTPEMPEQNLAERKLEWVREKLSECEVPDDVEEISTRLASNRLDALFALVASKRDGGRGRQFFGMSLGDDSEAILSQLNPQAAIDRWTTALVDAHGDVGLSFVGEVASRYGIEIEGAVLRKGRKQLTFLPNPPVPPKNPTTALGESILSAPEDRDSYLVWADMLQEAGDVHGELIALWDAADRDESLAEQRDTFTLEHRDALFGGLVEFARGTTFVDALDVEWFMGCIRRARIHSLDEEIDDLLAALLTAPVARALGDLTLGLLGFDGEVDYEAAIGDLEDNGPHPALQRLFIGDFDYPDESEMSWTFVGNVEPLWRVCPNLRELTLQGGDMRLGTIDAPQLKRLSLRTGGLPAEAVHSVVAASLPALEELEIWFGSEDYGAEADIEMVRPLLARTDLGQLRRLRLMNAEFTDDIVEALVDSPLLNNLEILDLSMGTMTRTGARTLLENINAFARVARIDVSDNCIEDDALDELVASGPVVSEEQKDFDEDYRYVSVGE